MFILLDRFLREAGEPTGATRTLPFRFTYGFIKRTRGFLAQSGAHHAASDKSKAKLTVGG